MTCRGTHNIDSCIKNAIMGVQQEDTRAKTRWFG